MKQQTRYEKPKNNCRSVRWLAKKRKAMQEKISEIAFLFLRWWKIAFAALLLFFALPYIVTMCWQGDSSAAEIKNRLADAQESPLVRIAGTHGTWNVPMETGLKGVLGTYLYAVYIADAESLKEDGGLLLWSSDITENKRENSSSVSLNGSSILPENESLRELAIRLRTILYEESLAADPNPDIDAQSDSFLYYTDAELEQLFGGRWNSVSGALEDAVEDTYGLVYGKDGKVSSVQLGEELEKEVELYLAW